MEEPVDPQNEPDEGPKDELIGVRIGNFTLEKWIGFGEVGTVYRADHIFLPLYKAVKVLNLDLSSNAGHVRRFQNEALAASACQHDHIIRIEDSGSFWFGGHEHHYIEMELLEGQDLNAACFALKGHRIDDIDRAVKIIAQAADALAAVHARGIVHRDIKPQNLFLAKRGSRTDYVKLLDFGIARLTGELSPGTRTRTGQLLSVTKEYMSPEMADRVRVDDKTDVWSLAVVLYRVLAGFDPFEGDNFARVAAAIKTTEPTPLARVRPDVPQGIIRAVERGMRKRAADRPTMAEWRDMILAADAAPRAVLPELSISSPGSLRHVTGPIAARSLGTSPHGVALTRAPASTPRMVPLAAAQARGVIASVEPASPITRPRRSTD